MKPCVSCPFVGRLRPCPLEFRVKLFLKAFGVHAARHLICLGQIAVRIGLEKLQYVRQPLVEVGPEQLAVRSFLVRELVDTPPGDLQSLCLVLLGLGTFK